MLSGEDEARLTFLAVRRWFGWSAGRLAVFDIGGGSLEIAGGSDEAPDVAWSLPLGAARLAREHFARRRPDEDDVRALRKQIRAEIARGRGPAAARWRRPTRRPRPRRRSGRWPGSAAPRRRATARWSPRVARPSPSCGEWIPKLIDDGADELAELPGVSPSRAPPDRAGRAGRRGVMDIFDLTELEICPWALREGVILERLDQISAP